MEDAHTPEWYRLCPKKGELKIKSRIFKKLETLIAEQRSRKNFLKECKVRLRLSESGFLPEVISAPPSVLIRWGASLNIPVSGFNSNKDLEKGHYEGGCKVWEATEDLVKFMTEDQCFITKLFEPNKKLRVLELGCGSGLASIAFLSRLIAEENFNSEYRIHVQDYNWTVLATLTLANFSLNLPLEYIIKLIETSCLRFFYGDWAKFRQGLKHYPNYDLIMMSETIYDYQSYIPLHDLMDKHLNHDGYVVMATKDTYFGLSGGLYLWLDFLAVKNIFIPVKILKISKTNIPRSILILRRSSFVLNGNTKSTDVSDYK